jgi:Transcription factor WhiB
MTDWQLALCREDPELFFPHKSEFPDGAIAMCMRCVCLDACREATFELEQREGRQFGIWAGLTEDQRRRKWSCKEYARQ